MAYSKLKIEPKRYTGLVCLEINETSRMNEGSCRSAGSYCFLNILERLYSWYSFLFFFLSQDEQEKLKKKRHFDFLDTLLAARVIET